MHLEREGRSKVKRKNRPKIQHASHPPPPDWLPCALSCLSVCSAGLSGQVLDTTFALEWGRRILKEFRRQAALEATAGLPVTTLPSGDMETTMKGQHFFAAKVGVGVGVALYLVFGCRGLGGFGSG